MASHADRDSFEQEVTFRRGTNLPDGLALAGSANDRVIAFLRDHPGVDDNAVFAVNLAFEELATNIARHALPRSGDDICFWSRVEVGSDDLVLTLRDDGPEYDPFSRPERVEPITPEEGQFGGMGLDLVRNMFPENAYSRDNGCNVIRLRYIKDKT